MTDNLYHEAKKRSKETCTVDRFRVNVFYFVLAFAYVNVVNYIKHLLWPSLYLYLENHCLWIMYLKFYIACHSIFTQLLVLDQLFVTRWFVTKGWFSLASWVGVGVGVVIRSVRFNNLVKMAFWFCLRLCCSWSSELLKSQAEAEELNRFCFWLFL